MCSMFDISPETLANEYLAFAFNNKFKEQANMDHLKALEAHLHTKMAARFRLQQDEENREPDRNAGLLHQPPPHVASPSAKQITSTPSRRSQPQQPGYCHVE